MLFMHFYFFDRKYKRSFGWNLDKLCKKMIFDILTEDFVAKKLGTSHLEGNQLKGLPKTIF